MNECYVYMIRNGSGSKRPIKIGMANNPSKRIKELQTGNPEILHIVMTVKCNSRKHARLVEKTLHNQLCGVNILGEWYQVKQHALYKALSRLAQDPDCNIIEDINIKPLVDNTRQMLRTQRKKNEGQSKQILELQDVIKKRKERCANYRKIIKKLGLSDTDISKLLKDMEV